MAKAGEREAPPVPAPRPLRPLLRHSRLTAAALSVIRRALDDDEEFRARVASAVDEESVGRAGWLFLARPDGWDDELASLSAASASAAAEVAEARDERTAARRLRGAEEALRRAEAGAADARAAAARAAEELAEERQARRRAEAEAGELRARLARAEASLAAAEARIAALEAEVVAAAAAAAAAAAVGRAVSPPPAPVAVVPPEAADAVARARAAAEAIQAALAEASAVLASPVAEPAPVPEGRRRPARRSSGARRGRRRPAPLPPAVFEDAPEAAEHLVRLPGAVLFVDGYNASLAYRPALPIAELRRRLIDAVDELVARTGIEATVVFDGAEVDDDRPTRAGGRRRSARVVFSPPDLEADDLILEFVDAAPADRPVIVASDDRRVRDGARERGANVLSSAQLLVALRRER